MTYRVCFVCTGNICRSPMAETVMRQLVHEAGLAGRVEVDSAGTDGWHVGDGADHRALSTLDAAGYDGSGHRARAFDRRWLAERDLVVALDRGHLRELRLLATDPAEREKVVLLGEFAEGPVADVADPYYGGAAEFRTVLAQLEQACRGLLDHLVDRGPVGADTG